MEELYSNLKHLTHIKVKDKTLSQRYTKYNPAKEDRLFLKGNLEYWSGSAVFGKQTEKWLTENGYVIDENKTVWAKPEIKIYFNDKREPITFTVDTYEDAISYRNNVLEIAKQQGGDFVILADIKINNDGTGK